MTLNHICLVVDFSALTIWSSYYDRSYIVHIILQSIEIRELQELCCTLLGHLLDKVESSSLSANALGDQLQVAVTHGSSSFWRFVLYWRLWFLSFFYFALFVLQSIVSKLVSCITAYKQNSVGVDELQPNGSPQPHVLLVGLLERLTVNASHVLHDSIKVRLLSTESEPKSDSVGSVGLSI